MANVGTSLKNWSTTEASNQPDGSDSATIAGDLRAIQAGVRYLRTNDTIASASTCDLGSKDAEYLSISGTTTITALGTVSAGIVKRVVFEGALTLTHNGTSLILPGAANITTAAGDAAEFVSLGGGNWRCTQYQLASGGVLALANDSVTFAKIQNIATSRILGRSTALSGDIEELTIGAGLTLSGGQLSATGGAQIPSISASVAANALTISASALSLDFRSTTLGSGTVTTVTGTPANLVISSGSTLGTVNATQSDIVVLAINNSGTIELAAVNISGGTQLDETNLISTTAEGGAGAADSATVVYSTTARTNVAYRVLGIIRSTQTTAGTWATAPSLIQGAGGNALQAMSSLGYGQTWQSVTGSRALGTTYYNTTGKPILISVRTTNATSTATMDATIGGVNFSVAQGAAGSGPKNAVVIVPAGMSYSITETNTPTLVNWTELR